MIESDPNDNMILECAFAGNAKYIITGDRHLLDLESYKEIIILKASEFFKRIE
jgi:predicted nucleic acid-binding protein